MSDSPVNEADVIIIGGGATGAGMARDCARAACALCYWSGLISRPARPAVTTACCTVVPVMR